MNAHHRRIADEIAAGRAAEAERVAHAHLAATQQLVLSRFQTDIVTVLSARHTFGSSRPAGGWTAAGLRGVAAGS